MTKKKIIVALALVLALGAGIGAYLYFMDWGNAESTVKPTEISDPVRDLSEIQGVFVSTDNEEKQEIMFSAEGLKSTIGKFKQFDVTLDLTSGLSEAKIDVVIDVASIYTKNSTRDDHLKSDEFFNIDIYPTIKFNAIGIEKKGDNYITTGTISMLGQETDLKLPFEYKGKGSYENGDTFIAFHGTFEIDAAKYGLAESSTVENVVGLEFYVELVEKK